MDNDPIRDRETPTLRLWPGVAGLTLAFALRFGLPLLGETALLSVAFLGGLIVLALVIVWWLFLSRAPWLDRVAGLAAIVLSFFAVKPFLDESIATAGMGVLYPMYAVPVLVLGLVVGAVVGRRLPTGPRLAVLVATVLAAGASWTLVRTSGVSGDFDWDFAWRWSATPEARLLADREGVPSPVSLPGGEPAGEPEWPGFRGPGRDGVARSTPIGTDWASAPPTELWRRPVGPGWSSFAVHGDRLYTQEQRGDHEAVSCYRVATGEPIWRHTDEVRFWEAMAGAGPRSTPTLAGGRVYALGATGILNVLDAGDGRRLWSRDLAAELGAEIPGWGFAGSPLVTGDVVIVALAGRLAAYDLADGAPRWTGPEGSESYGSPHAVTIGGIPQVLLLNGPGLVSVDPLDGELLWSHDWAGFHSLQPALAGDGDLVIGNADSSSGVGARRLDVTLEDGSWSAVERWTTRGLKPYFNDFVLHRGHAYGFDGRILSAVDLETGERVWKGGRYGHGQLLLLPGQDLLLVLSEQGDLALVAARPGGFEEIARMPAIEGKTWNHPVVVGDLLLVRNAEQMAAFRLPTAG